MKKLNLSFEKLFASQMTVMGEKFPESIVNLLWEKKDLLQERVEALDLKFEDGSIPFVPVIPVRKMKCLSQVAHFVYYKQGPSAEFDIFSMYLNGFFYNEERACDLSHVHEIGFLLDVKSLKISTFKIPAGTNHNEIGSELRSVVKKSGYIPANHVEAFGIANMTGLLPTFDRFCALNFDWEGFEFGEIFHGRDLKFGLSWFTPSFNPEGKFVKEKNQNNYEVLIPVYKESI